MLLLWEALGDKLKFRRGGPTDWQATKHSLQAITDAKL